MWELITPIATAVITGVLGPFFIWWAKKQYKQEENAKKSIDEEVQFAQQIQDELNSIRKEIGGDRIWIAQFHNGGKILNLPREASMKRISITQEVTASGISKEQRELNDILVSFFSETIDVLLREEHVCFHSGQKELEPEIRLIIQERGNEKMHLFAMRDIEGELMGIMGVDFVSEKEKLSKQEIQYLTVKANLLAGYVIHGQVEN